MEWFLFASTDCESDKYSGSKLNELILSKTDLNTLRNNGGSLSLELGFTVYEDGIDEEGNTFSFKSNIFKVEGDVKFVCNKNGILEVTIQNVNGEELSSTFNGGWFETELPNSLVVALKEHFPQLQALDNFEFSRYT